MSLKQQPLTYNFDVLVFIEHEVLRLEVSVHDFKALHVLERVYQLGRVQPN